MMRVLLGLEWMRRAFAKLLPVRCPVGSGTVTLARGEVWSRRVRTCSFTLTCHEGWVWLTREGDAADHVLAAGDFVRLEQPGLVVVQALRPARFELQRTTLERATLPHTADVATR